MLLRMIVASLLISVAPGALSRAANASTELAATHGFVRVSLPQWQFASQFVLRNVRTREVSTPSRAPEHGPYSHGLWLPAGDYELPDIRTQDGGRYEQIVVKASELTDLGAVLRIQLGGYESVLLPLQHAEAAQETAAAQAQLGALITNTSHWQPSTPPRSVKAAAPSTGLGLIADLLSAYGRKVNKPPLSKQLREARTLETLTPLAKLAAAPRVEEAGVDGESNYYYGADFGQIRVRQADGVWGSIDSGTLDEITTVEASGPRLVAGTLRGALLTSADSGRSWIRLRRVEADEIAVDIDRMGARWFVLAAQSAGQANPWMLARRLRVYSATQDDLSDLAPMKDFALPKNAYARIGGLPDSLVGQAMANAYLVNTITELQRLDVDKLQWTAAKPPHRVDSFQVSSDGALITAKRLQGAFSKISVSSDAGVTWKPYSRPPYTIYDAVLETPDSGRATRWNADAFSASLEFYTYDPKIGDWRKSGETPAGCVQMLRDAAYRQRFCLTSGGSILDQQNGEWVVEFANE